MIETQKIVCPPFLKEGDKVALISPAYWIPEGAIEGASEVLRSWGLRPVKGKYTDVLNAGAYAGDADQRAADLLWAFHDDEIKAIVCTRGGYGSIHLLDRIPKNIYSEHPKWIIGHGDITTLLFAQVGAGVTGIYGPMALELASGLEPNARILHDMLFGTLPQYEIQSHPLNHNGHAEGILIGGNLSSFAPLIGSRFHFNKNQDIILFIEEVEESLHSIDRLFYLLELQGLINQIKGIILGEFAGIKYDLQFNSAEEMLTQHIHDLKLPVCCGFPTGSNNCMPLFEGAQVSLDITDEKTLLTFHIAGKQALCQLKNKETPLMK